MGNILLTQEGLETSTIEKEKRSERLRNFYEMIDQAMKAGDSCFITEAASQHQYSYGEYFPKFLHLSWDEFQKIESLKGIKQQVYEYITTGFQNRFTPSRLKDEDVFEQKALPRGRGGFEHSDSPEEFLCDLPRWEKWHCDHLTAHPDEIRWDENSPFIPNMEAVYKILKDEVLIYIKQEYKERMAKVKNSEQEISEQEIKKIWSELYVKKVDSQGGRSPMKGKAIVLFFHRVVLPSKNKKEMTAYCREIGGKVCQANHYQHESELTNCEQQTSHSLREIYSIVKNGVKQYISFDFHKGMFEFHDEKGNHLGEFMFDGTENKGAEKDHNLRCLGKQKRSIQRKR
jgi:hypothetical protein